MNNPQHFVIDLYNCAKVPLSNQEDCGRYLKSVVKYLGLKAVGEPNIYQFKGEHPDDNGITASLILSTSLIDIHTYPRERACYISLFACSDYDSGLFYDFTKKWYSASKVHMNRVVRMPYKSP
jgi:S-adenosylmethionine/arginine decarboxylase-like enzyme